MHTPAPDPKPILSVVVPVFRTEAYLAECLDSLLNQTLRDIEILVIDDASPDGSLAIARQYGARDARVRVIVLPENRGQSVARNQGLAEAQGKYVTFVDSDDLLPAEALARLVRVAEEDEADICTGIAESFTSDRRWLNRQMLEVRGAARRSTTLAAVPLLARDASPCTKIFRKELLDKHQLRFPEGIEVREDLHFVLRAYAQARRVSILPDITYHYRAREDAANLSHTQRFTEKILRDLLIVARSLDGALQAQNVAPAVLREMHAGLIQGVLFRLRAYLRDPTLPPIESYLQLFAAYLQEFDSAIIATAPDGDERLIAFALRAGGVRAACYLAAHGVDEALTEHICETHLICDRAFATELAHYQQRRVTRLAARNRPQHKQSAFRRTLKAHLTKHRVPLTTRAVAREAKLIAAKMAIMSAPSVEDVWLVGERRGDSIEDTGFHFFKYLRTTHPEIPAYFVAKPDAKGLEEARDLGNVLTYGSAEAYRRLLEARVLAYTDCGQDFFHHWRRIRSELRPDAIGCFLQHGVIGTSGMGSFYKHSRVLERGEKAELFVVSSEREKSYVVNDLGYGDEQIIVTGLSRFDALHRARADAATSKTILIMPTWRVWLRKRDVEAFKLSQYRMAWQAVLDDARLHRQLEERGFDLVFCCHFAMAKFTEAFSSTHPRVKIESAETSRIQSLIQGAAAFVTDYSSTAFDAAYLGRPVAFYQFDAERFHALRGHSFIAENEFIGPVIERHEDLITELADTMERGASVLPDHAQRVSSFFAYNDANNCERIYDAIRSRLK